jgi:hypothetical protein
MRELKFELITKHTVTGQMFNNTYDIDEILCQKLSSCSLLEVIAKRQFTGMKCQNGNELFERDVIACRGFTCSLEVAWCDDFKMWALWDDGDYVAPLSDVTDGSFEIIDNTVNKL